jgi:hypothetical protein
VAFIAACGGIASSNAGGKLEEIDKKANQYAGKVYVPPFPSGSIDLQNYEWSQRLFANPATIIWCTAFPQSSSAPIITVPVSGKLTSSSVSFFPSTRSKTGGGGSDSWTDEYTPERRSVDGMYHGTPPPYRYGRTPGGQYVDFFNMDTVCTTAPLKFQRQSVKVEVDGNLNEATSRAEAALKSGNRAEAQRILEGATAGG